VPCVCGLGESTETHCLPIIKGTAKALTAEAVMRARYAGYVLGEIDFIMDSLHPEHRKDVDRKSSETWSKKAKWLGLEILSTKDGGENDDSGEVEFRAHFEMKELRQEHHERATFERYNGKWYFVDGQQVSNVPVVREGPRVGRNDPCPCGSGKKHKKCCGKAA
jgi:SEC-C motif-containing protein